MSEVPVKVVIDCATGQEEIVPLTEAEIAEAEVMRAEAEARRVAAEAEAQAKAEAKASAQAKLAALGLTVDEIAALS